MTIDERLEALTQTMELLALSHKSLIEAQTRTDATLNTLEGTLKTLAEAQIKADQRVDRIGRYAILVARDHEARLAALETN